MWKPPKKSAVPSISTVEAKAQLRRQVRQQLAAIPEEVRLAQDTELFDAFLALPQVQQAQTLFLFYGVGTEPHTAPLLKQLIALV